MKISEEYQSLYHYTSYKGLEGILKTQTLWATHYKYLNDAQELIHAKIILKALLKPKMTEIVTEGGEREKELKELIDLSGGSEKFIEQECEKFIKTMYETFLGDSKEQLQGPYIVSFCADNNNSFVKENGLLSQWRGYGKDGGFAIEFDALELEKLFITEHETYYYPVAQFADVGYGQAFNNMPSDLKENIVSLEKGLNKFFDSGADLKGMREVLEFFVKLIGRSKHEGFREEREVRIIFYPGTDFLRQRDGALEVKNRKVKSIELRAGALCPFIDLFEEAKKLPMRKIIIGPHKDQLLREKALKMKLIGTDIKVISSQIPFLGN